jgi:hypothetical protein
MAEGKPKSYAALAANKPDLSYECLKIKAGRTTISSKLQMWSESDDSIAGVNNKFDESGK